MLRNAGADRDVVLPMRRQTIGVQIRAILRREIIKGQLLPRSLLSEQDLSQRFGVSRTPVREALIKLAEENLVETYPQYGSFVAPIKLRDVFDSQFVREALECAAIERAVERMDAAQSKALTSVLDRQRALHRANDTDGFFEADERMHALIVEIAGHPQAWRQVENAKAQMDRVRYLTVRLPRKQSSVLAEHGAIVDRLIGRDRAGAIEAMRVHLRGLFRSVEILKSENASYFADDAQVPTAPPRVAAAGTPARHEADKRADGPCSQEASHEDHADQDVPDAGRLAIRSRLGLGRQGPSDRISQLAVRQSLHRRGHLRRRRVLRLAARDRSGSARPRRHSRRRGPDAHREALAEDDGRPDGARRHRRGRRRRHERHRHGAVGHQGQGAQHAGLEPARRAGARPHPHLFACLRAGRGAGAESARHHRGQDRRRARSAAQGRRHSRSRRRRRGHHGRPARSAMDDAQGCHRARPGAGALPSAVPGGSGCAGEHRVARARLRRPSPSRSQPASVWPPSGAGAR